MTSGQPSGISHAAAGGTSPAAASGPAKRSGRVPVPGKVDAAGRPVTRLPDGTLLSQRYELSFLAAGGMGAVYRARDRQGGAEVIVKEAFSRNPDDHAMVIVALTQEREALIRLDHHGIVKALDFFIENGAAYLVLEYVKGQTLEALIGAGKPLDEGDAVSIALQVCEVLEHIHSHGLVYRDLKPENIMVGDDGKVKLIDFGTVRLYKSGQRKDTSALGTVGFAPPEQFGHGQTDRRSDVYSLGVSLHYMLTRRHPDEAPFHFPPLRTLNPSASEALEILVARAVQSVADQRFASAAQMREALIATRKVCPVCGTMNRARGKFCIKCGQALPGGSGPVPPPVAVAKPPTVKAPAGLPATTMVAGTAPVAMPTVAGLGATGPVGPASLAPPPAAVAQSQLLTRPALAGGHPPPPLSGPVLPLHPTPGPIKSGRVWRVDLLGRGDFVRISDAVGAARPGDVIEVGPGTYQESLRVDEQLVIKGAGAKLTRVVSAVNRPVLEISSSDGTWVEGMTLEYNGARPNCAVWVKNSKAIVQGCAIHGATLSGVEFGAQSSGEIRCNDISGNHQTGIFIHSRSTVGIFGNHIHDNGLATRTAGIEVREQSHLAIEGNLIGNNGIALYIHGSSNPTVRGNTIVANGQGSEFMALEIKERSDPLIEGNLILENSGGILVKGRSHPRIVGNHLLRNGMGLGGSALEVLEASEAVIEGNLIEGNGAGVAVREGGRPRIRRNQIIANGMGGNVSALEVGGASQAVIDHNLVARNTAGILVHDVSRAQILDNVIVENGLGAELNGIEVRGQSDAVVFHNIVLRNGGAGTWFHRSSTGELRNNIIAGNLRGVVASDKRSSSLMMECNNVWGNQRDYVSIARPTTDVSADPMFVDEHRWDFRLMPGSPSATAGMGRVALGPR